MRAGALFLLLFLASGCRLLTLKRLVQPEPLTPDRTEKDYMMGLSGTLDLGLERTRPAGCPEPPFDAPDPVTAWTDHARCLEEFGRFGAAERARATAARLKR